MLCDGPHLKTAASSPNQRPNPTTMPVSVNVERASSTAKNIARARVARARALGDLDETQQETGLLFACEALARPRTRHLRRHRRYRGAAPDRRQQSSSTRHLRRRLGQLLSRRQSSLPAILRKPQVLLRNGPAGRLVHVFASDGGTGKDLLSGQVQDHRLPRFPSLLQGVSRHPTLPVAHALAFVKVS